MKVTPYDISAGAPIAPFDVLDYLHSTGWAKLDVYTDRGMDRSAIWESPDGSVELYVPLRPTDKDYPRLLAEVVNQVADAEKRPAPQVLSDLRFTRADIVRVRCLWLGPSSSLPLAGAALFPAAADMVSAAASAAVSPRPAYSGRRPKEVSEFSKSAAFGQTEEGSFVVRVVVPVPANLPPAAQLPLKGMGEQPSTIQQPFNRKVTETLLRAVQNAHQAASQAMLDRSMEPFRDRVECGVSADLCKALAAMMPDPGAEQVEVSITWSRIWPVRIQDLRPVMFTRDVLEVLGQASVWLREVEPREDFELVGFVSQLSREPGQGPGEITVVGSIDDKWRQVRVELDEMDYMRAYEAHGSQAPVMLTGTLQREGRRYRLVRPQQLRLVPDLDAP